MVHAAYGLVSGAREAARDVVGFGANGGVLLIEEACSFRIRSPDGPYRV